MKSVFIAGSRKFYDEIEKLNKKLKYNEIKSSTAGKWDKNQEDTLESEKSALLKAFEIINESDILYIFADRGYIGKTVAMEIAYAYSKNKEIISSHEIEELSAKSLVSKILTKEELVEYCKL